MADPKILPECGPVVYRPAQASSPDREKAEALLASISGVRGVGEGRDAIGNPAWIAYVENMSVANRLPAKIKGRSVVTEVTGVIDSLKSR